MDKSRTDGYQSDIADETAAQEAERARFARGCLEDLCFAIVHGKQPAFCDDFATIMFQGNADWLMSKVQSVVATYGDNHLDAMWDLRQFCDDAIRDYLRDSDALARYIEGRREE